MSYTEVKDSNDGNKVVCIKYDDGNLIHYIPVNPELGAYNDYLDWVDSGNTPEEETF